MMPGQFATHHGRTVQVLRIEGGQSRNWGSSPRMPTVFTLKPWPHGETYTVTDPGADLRPCDTPDGYQDPRTPETAPRPRFYTSGAPW